MWAARTARCRIQRTCIESFFDCACLPAGRVGERVVLARLKK